MAFLGPFGLRTGGLVMTRDGTSSARLRRMRFLYRMAGISKHGCAARFVSEEKKNCIGRCWSRGFFLQVLVLVLVFWSGFLFSGRVAERLTVRSSSLPEERQEHSTTLHSTA